MQHLNPNIQYREKYVESLQEKTSHCVSSILTGPGLSALNNCNSSPPKCFIILLSNSTKNGRSSVPPKKTLESTSKRNCAPSNSENISTECPAGNVITSSLRDGVLQSSSHFRTASPAVLGNFPLFVRSSSNSLMVSLPFFGCEFCVPIR